MIVRQEEPNKHEMDSVQLYIMNTCFYIAISNEDRTDWKKTIIAFLQYVEREFSRFRNDNELRRFNDAKRDSMIVVSPVLYDLLKKADDFRLKTEGRFSPYLLTQMDAHGYNQSFPFRIAQRDETVIPYQNEEEPLIFKKDCQVIKKTNQKIDLGGIAKGYAVEAVAMWLKKHTHSNYGIVDGGGDMAIWSNGEKNWKIGVMDPFDEEKEITSFFIQNGGVATSNIIYRSWMQGETKKHHILDGRTGMPTITEIVQATVVTEHCLDAEISAKLLFMDDILSAKYLLSNINRQFNYLLVNSNGTIENGGISKNEL